MNLERHQRADRLNKISEEKEELIESIEYYGKFKSQITIKECLEEDLKKIIEEENLLLKLNKRFLDNLHKSTNL